MKLPAWMVPSDLAEGDKKSLGRDWREISLELVPDAKAPSFDATFGALWSEFGAAGEMERRDVIAGRMAWDPAAAHLPPMLYEMMRLTRAGEFVAATDQTAILVDGCTVIHHSHMLVAPAWRRTGLAGWVRALPLSTARRLLAGRDLRETTIVAEMEHPDPANPATLARLSAMEKAGYRKVDPARVGYVQPDFRPQQEMDDEGPAPLPLALVLRRVGRESEETISGAELRRTVAAVYEMYARGMHPEHSKGLRALLAAYPAPDEPVRLVPPTA